jgi:homoprotocatechuate degradation regulator HpaR
MVDVKTPAQPGEAGPGAAASAASGRASPLARRNLPLLLLQAREAVIAQFRPLLKHHRVTEQQWRIVRVLVEFGALEPREIGALCAISSPSLAGILARMEQQGLVARTALAHDRRRQAVTPTAKSEALAERLAPAIEAVYARIEAALGHGTVRTLDASLDHVVGTLGGAAPRDD